MSAMIATGVFVGAGQDRSVPQQLGAILYIPDLNTPVNGYWQDKSGKGKLVQAATTTVANDSLIMPANDADIIAALTLAGAYSKYYTNDSTPKTVLVSQIASIDSKYAVFFDAKTKTKFSLFKTQGDEARADKMYEFTFKAYTGGYFPITQTSDSVSFIIRGTGTHIFDWDDGTTTSYTLTTGADTTVSHTWSTNLGGQKNISVSGIVKNWTRFSQNARTTDDNIVRLSSIKLVYLHLYSCPNIGIIGSIDGMILPSLQIYNCSKVALTGSISGMPITYLLLAFSSLLKLSGITSSSNITYLQLYNCPLITISISITNKPLTVLYLDNCPLISGTGSITNMLLTVLYLDKCPSVSISGPIETCTVAASTIFVKSTGIVYGGGAVKAWGISQTIYAEWSTAMIDSYLNAFAVVAPTVTNKFIDLRGNNSGRSSASDASVATLVSRGWSVYSNNGYIFEGDSITYGTGASPISESWVNKLMAIKGGSFVNNGIQGQTMVHYVGNNSYPSFADVKARVAPYFSNNKLILAFGMNDCSLVTVNQFITDYTEVLNYLINTKGYPISQMHILNIYYSTSKATICQPYNTALAALALLYDIQLIDIYTHMLNNGGASLISADTVHPNNTGHTVIASYVSSQIV